MRASDHGAELHDLPTLAPQARFRGPLGGRMLTPVGLCTPNLENSGFFFRGDVSPLARRLVVTGFGAVTMKEVRKRRRSRALNSLSLFPIIHTIYLSLNFFLSLLVLEFNETDRWQKCRYTLISSSPLFLLTIVTSVPSFCL